MSSPQGDLRDLSEIVAEQVTAVDGVAGLHAGTFGEAATYLPGRKVAGIRISDQGTEVHVTLLFGNPVRDTAEAIRAVVAGIAPGPVHVIVEDVISPPASA